MRNAFVLSSFVGLAYLAVLVATAQPAVRKMFRRQFNPRRLADRLQSEAFQEILRQAGINITAKRLNLFRLYLSAGILLAGYGPAFFQNEQPTTIPLILVFLVWFLTSPRPFTLGGFIYSRLTRRQQNRKNGELMSLLKLYENNKRLQDLKFEHFLKRVAPHFRLLKNDLIILSERVTDDGLHDALNWFVNQFPPNHPFVGQIRTIILATEGKEGEEAVRYLDQESHTIARISNDMYLSRWNTISAFATVVNAIPSFAMFFLIILLVLYHITLVREQVF